MIFNNIRLLKISSYRKLKLVLSRLVTTWLSNIAFHLRPIGLQTSIAIDSESCHIVSKLLCAAIWSCCAVQFESEQTPFLRTGRRFRPAAFCSYVIFLRSDGRSFGQQQLLANSTEIIISREKKSDSSWPDTYKSLKPCWLSNWVSIARVVARFPQASRLLPAATASNSETPCVCARPSNRPSCAGARPQELGRWFCPLNLRLSSGTAFGSDCQMTGRGSNLDSNLNSAAWPTSCKGFIASKITA